MRKLINCGVYGCVYKICRNETEIRYEEECSDTYTYHNCLPESRNLIPSDVDSSSSKDDIKGKVQVYQELYHSSETPLIMLE